MIIHKHGLKLVIPTHIDTDKTSSGIIIMFNHLWERDGFWPEWVLKYPARSTYNSLPGYVDQETVINNKNDYMCFKLERADAVYDGKEELFLVESGLQWHLAGGYSTDYFLYFIENSKDKIITLKLLVNKLKNMDVNKALDIVIRDALK